MALLSGTPGCGGKTDADGGSHVVGSGKANGGGPMTLPPFPTAGFATVPDSPPAVGGKVGSSSGGASQVGVDPVAEAGAPAAGGSVDFGSCNAGGAAAACDFGLPCSRDNDCAELDCYVPGNGENPICTKPCLTNSDCPRGSACTGPFGDASHCFVLCSDPAQCLAINDAPENPLDCVDMADPRAPQGQTVCAQSSEP